MNLNYAMFILEKNVRIVGQSYIVAEDVVQIVIIRQEALIKFMNMDASYLKRELNVLLW